MELLLDEHGQIRMEDGKPVYKREDGQELAFDAKAAMQKIHALNNEAKSHRLRAEELESRVVELESRLAVVADIEDLEAWRSQANEALAAADQHKSEDILTREESDKLREEALAPLREEAGRLRKAAARYKAMAVREALSALFARSRLVRDQLNLPLEAVEAMFRKHFQLKNGRLEAHDGKGTPLFGPGGKPAEAEEALELLIAARFPDRSDARVWKASGGGGADNGAGLARTTGPLALTRGQALDTRNYRLRRDEAQRSGKPLIIQG